jgi:hypothetical protein
VGTQPHTGGSGKSVGSDTRESCGGVCYGPLLTAADFPRYILDIWAWLMARSSLKTSGSCRHEAHTGLYLGLISGPSCQTQHNQISLIRPDTTWPSRPSNDGRLKPNPKAPRHHSHSHPHSHAAAPRLIHPRRRSSCTALHHVALPFYAAPHARMPHPSLPRPPATNAGARSPLSSSPQSGEVGSIAARLVALIRRGGIAGMRVRRSGLGISFFLLQ